MLTIQEMLLILAFVAVVGIGVLVRFGARRRAAAAEGEERNDDLNHRVRALEADLRVAQRKAQEAELAVERQREEMDELRSTLKTREETLAEQKATLDEIEQQFAKECSKTQTLRKELTERATESVKATVRVKDAETELSVLKAGSDAVLDQMLQLAAEREQLTGRIEAMKAESGNRPIAKVSRLPVRDSRDR